MSERIVKIPLTESQWKIIISDLTSTNEILNSQMVRELSGFHEMTDDERSRQVAKCDSISRIVVDRELLIDIVRMGLE